MKTTYPFILLALCLVSAAAQAQHEVLVNRDQALMAYTKFEADPLNNLDQAPSFLKFIETDGEVHIVLDQKLTTWMYEDHPPEARAILYAAYMGSNMHAQLTGLASGDDPVAGMRGVLHAYGKLGKKYADLSIPVLDALADAEQEDSLAPAVSDLQNQE
ncbi:MAG: hypothetical protein AAF387_06430 [Pseudomonadota bacterium]